MSIKKVTLCGGGVLGSQIAFQTAYCGYDVTIWLRTEESIKRTQKKLDNLKKTYTDKINSMEKDKSYVNWARGIASSDKFDKKKCLDNVNKAYKNIKLELSLEKAVKNCDLVIEAMAEDLKLKREFYKKLSGFLEEKTIVVSNSSTIAPSKMSSSTKREDKFLSLHFANEIWKNNTAEVMATAKTDKKYFDQVMKFATSINMVALPLYKEKSGYLLNSMLVPLLLSALDLYATGVSDIKSIDAAWKLATGSPKGPFEILDVIGLETAHNIALMYVKTPSFLAPYHFKEIEKLLKKYLDEGKTGVASKEGFYKYK